MVRSEGYTNSQTSASRKLSCSVNASTSSKAEVFVPTGSKGLHTEWTGMHSVVFSFFLLCGTAMQDYTPNVAKRDFALLYFNINNDMVEKLEPFEGQSPS